MAPKRKRLAPPPPPAKTSDSDCRSESDVDPQPKIQNTPKKPSESKKRPNKFESKKRPNESSSSVAQRIWSEADEIALLRALSQYRDKNGKLPSKKDYASFLSIASGSIGFPATDKQLYGKVRHLKRAYFQRRKKGSDAKFSSSHEEAVFELGKALFEESHRKVVKEEVRKDVSVEAGGDVANGSGAANGGAGVSSEPSYMHLRGLLEEMIGEQRFSWSLPTVEDGLARIRESKVQDLDDKMKIWRRDARKLFAREKNLKAELLSILTNEMADD